MLFPYNLQVQKVQKEQIVLHYVYLLCDVKGSNDGIVDGYMYILFIYLIRHTQNTQPCIRNANIQICIPIKFTLGSY